MSSDFKDLGSVAEDLSEEAWLEALFEDEEHVTSWRAAGFVLSVARLWRGPVLDAVRAQGGDVDAAHESLDPELALRFMAAGIADSEAVEWSRPSSVTT